MTSSPGTCCTGGATVAVLWEPTLVRVQDEYLTLHGFERLEERSMAQEWRLKPHVVQPWVGNGAMGSKMASMGS